MEVAKCSLPPDDSGTQAKEGMKEREGDKKKRGREAGGKQGKAKSRIKRATPLLASVALAMVVEALLNFQLRSEARAQ